VSFPRKNPHPPPLPAAGISSGKPSPLPRFPLENADLHGHAVRKVLADCAGGVIGFAYITVALLASAHSGNADAAQGVFHWKTTAAPP
jgi:hypothetical protein